MATVSSERVCSLAYEGALGELKAELAADKSRAGTRDQSQRTPLHWAASAGHCDVAVFLLSLGAPVDACDD
ncbi:unnamed protein product, partial [Lampetra planeri]